MNPYVYEVTCDVCGGPGVATPRGMASQWIEGTTLSHRDPSVCRGYIESLRQELDEAKEKLKEKS